MELPESSNHDRTEMFLACFSKEQRSIYAVIRTMLFDRADADEVFQETSLALWRDFHKYSPGTDFGAWARQVARHRVLAFGKRKKSDRHRFSADLAEELVRESEEFDQQMAGRQEALGGCLGRLDDGDLRLIRVRYSGTPSLRDYARQQGATVESLYKKLARIRRRLADCIDRSLRASRHPVPVSPDSGCTGGEL